MPLTEVGRKTLLQVADAIVAQPKRYDQRKWHNEDENQKAISVEDKCGTVGCISGWVVFLHDGVEAYNKLEHSGIARRMEQITGISSNSRLFSATGASWLDGGKFFAAPEFSQEKAQAAADYIRQFVNNVDDHLEITDW